METKDSQLPGVPVSAGGEETQRPCCDGEGPEYEPGSVAEVFQLVDTVSRKLRRYQRRTINEADLTPAQYSVLTLLWERDGRQFVELASACCCSPSTVTGIVDTLENKGLVRREPHPEDRRSVLVFLTTRGKALEGATPGLGRILQGCCSGVSTGDLEQLTQLLRKLDEALVT
jgi:DNA-binding MarR family transcriptional regulator